MAIVRVRQHVNPLSSKYRTPVHPPPWQEVFAELDQPLHLDIGSARGQFLLDMAQQLPDWNFLGLEIREPLVIQANQRIQELGLTNLHFLFCNANNSLQPVLASLPTGSLHRVSIQFPDPWFKKRHQKRRVVQPEMVNLLAQYLVPGGWVVLQSDVQSVAREMCDRFQEHPTFVPVENSPWIDTNPFPVATERELSTLAKHEPVYRALLMRRKM